MRISKAAYAISKAHLLGLQLQLVSIREDVSFITDPLEQAQVETYTNDLCRKINKLQRELREC